MYELLAKSKKLTKGNFILFMEKGVRCSKAGACNPLGLLINNFQIYQQNLFAKKGLGSRQIC